MTEESLTIPAYSRVSGPVREMKPLAQSLLFAELSNASYFDLPAAADIVGRIGFPMLQFFSRDGAQAYLFQNEHDSVISCRGTEPTEWNDIKADANVFSVVTETFGSVHRGFKQEVDDLWPMLEEVLRQNTKTLWFTGHSLGGAMSTICAGRCFLSHIESMPEALFTFGSPRVGDRRFVNFVELNHSRWVNNNDIVTRVPPAWLGYRHGGSEMYIDSKGRLRQITGVSRQLDRLKGFLTGLVRFRIDHFSDHSIERYIDYIRAAADRSDEQRAA